MAETETNRVDLRLLITQDSGNESSNAAKRS